MNAKQIDIIIRMYEDKLGYLQRNHEAIRKLKSRRGTSAGSVLFPFLRYPAGSDMLVEEVYTNILKAVFENRFYQLKDLGEFKENLDKLYAVINMQDIAKLFGMFKFDEESPEEARQFLLSGCLNILGNTTKKPDEALEILIVLNKYVPANLVMTRLGFDFYHLYGEVLRSIDSPFELTILESRLSTQELEEIQSNYHCTGDMNFITFLRLIVAHHLIKSGNYLKVLDLRPLQSQHKYSSLLSDLFFNENFILGLKFLIDRELCSPHNILWIIDLYDKSFSKRLTSIVKLLEDNLAFLEQHKETKMEQPLVSLSCFANRKQRLNDQSKNHPENEPREGNHFYQRV
ncbi:hypothetical protein [Legionella shakespearei]|uniref:Uncharacterized protein n=1 Tax=Legionella shakespearei DSM 23087 TaxID=1122169 RepID=A0A0W0YHM5_9GAMM|nr:hypothetical protein [Legionella shakespearei]KTD56456.1 hypothetical protein Lsha_2855 [Legionella shakespearei DSM 23087]